MILDATSVRFLSDRQITEFDNLFPNVPHYLPN